MHPIDVQNRKLDFIIGTLWAMAGMYAYYHGNHVLAGWLWVGAAIVAGAIELVAAAIVVVLKHMGQLFTRRQRRVRTRYKIGGQEFLAVPITRAVQEQLTASIPDFALEIAGRTVQLPGGIGIVMDSSEGTPDAAEQRKRSMEGLDTTYQQLCILLRSARTEQPPDAEWLGEVLPVARAVSLLGEIQERAQVEDNLPA